MTDKKTSFAPTPSGYLHLGNVYNALACQKWAKENNAKLVLRIDDIDRARFRIEYLEYLKHFLSVFMIEKESIFTWRSSLLLSNIVAKTYLTDGLLFNGNMWFNPAIRMDWLSPSS